VNNSINKVIAVLNDIEALDVVLKRAISLLEEKKDIENKLTTLGSKQEHIVLVKIDDTVNRVLELTKGDEYVTIVIQDNNAITAELNKKSNLHIVTVSI
jgi:hypothetical protein